MYLKVTMMISRIWNFTYNKIIIITIHVEKEFVGLCVRSVLDNEKRKSISQGNSGRRGVIWAGVG